MNVMKKFPSEARDQTRRDRGPDELWSLLIELALGLRSWWSETCAGLELTPTQGLVLKILDPESPLAMSALAGSLACDASNVTGVVDKLEARGLISRQPDENDRRVKALVVTPKGRELRNQLLACAAKAPAEVTALPKAVRDSMLVGIRSLLSKDDLDNSDDARRSGILKSAV